MGPAAAPLRRTARDPEGLVQAASSMLYSLARFTQKIGLFRAAAGGLGAASTHTITVCTTQITRIQNWDF
jgi:hypothetical protein